MDSETSKSERPPDTQPGPTGNFLHVIPTALGRGAQVFARALVDQLGGQAAGHELVSLFDGPQDISVDRSFSLPGGAAAVSGLHPTAAARLYCHLRQGGHDVLLAHGGDAFKYLAVTSGRPIAYCVIGTWPAGPRRLQQLLWRALVRRAAVVAPVSHDVAAECRELWSVPGDRIVVVPNGRDATRYRPAAPRTESTAVSSAAVSLLFVGRLDAGKRPDRFVELVRRLRAEGLAVTGKVVGDGPMKTQLQNAAASAGVELVGWCADVVPHLQRADLLVFPSIPDGEGMPGVLIEAGLCGLPAVATRVPGASTVIEHGTTGLLVPVDDRDALAQQVAELVRDPDRRSNMGAQARLRCGERFSLETVAGEWQALLSACAAHASGPGTKPAPAAPTGPITSR